MPNDVNRVQSIGMDLNCLEVPVNPKAKAFCWCFFGLRSEVIKFSGYSRQWQNSSIRLSYQILFVLFIFHFSSPSG